LQLFSQSGKANFEIAHIEFMFDEWSQNYTTYNLLSTIFRLLKEIQAIRINFAGVLCSNIGDKKSFVYL